MTLLREISEARTPREALASVRDWLEQAGMPTAAMAVHREMTDTALSEWGGLRDAFRVLEQFEADEEERIYEEAHAEGAAEGKTEGYEEGWAACEAAAAAKAEA